MRASRLLAFVFGPIGCLNGARPWSRSRYRWAMTPAPTVHDEIARGLKEHPAKKGMVFNALVTLVEIGGGIGLFHLAKSQGASDVVSYLVGSIGPIMGGVAI